MMLRRKALVFIVTLLVTASLLTVFTGCRGVTQAIIGSGNLITQEMDFTDFTKLEMEGRAPIHKVGDYTAKGIASAGVKWLRRNKNILRSNRGM